MSPPSRPKSRGRQAPAGRALLVCAPLLAATVFAAPIAFVPDGAARAADPTPFTVHRDWEAAVTTESGKPICFIGSAPQKEQGGYTKRGKAVILVTHRPDEKSFGIVSVQAGYTYKPDSEARLDIDGRIFTLFTDGGYAWARNADADRQLIAAMRTGRTLIVTGTSNRGTATIDTYSLNGFSAALDSIDAACKAR